MWMNQILNFLPFVHRSRCIGSDSSLGMIFGCLRSDWGIQDLSSVCNYCTVAFSNLLKGNNSNCKLFPSVAEHCTKEKVSVQGYY